MSWDAYVDYVISRSQGSVTAATLIGLNGAIWTPFSQEGGKIVKIDQTEASAIGAAMQKGKDAATTQVLQDYFAMNGVKVGGVKYMFLSATEDNGMKMVLGKKASLGGITIGHTNQAVIIAFNPEGTAQGNANKAVSATCEYLMQAGY